MKTILIFKIKIQQKRSYQTIFTALKMLRSVLDGSESSDKLFESCEIHGALP